MNIAKDFLKENYPEFKGFIEHTMVAEMAQKYAEHYHITPKRLFVVDEEINHKKYGTGKVKEVFTTKVIIQFNDREHPLTFLTYLFEQNLI